MQSELELEHWETYHVQSEEGPELDEAMEPAKNDGEGQIDDVARVAPEEADQLDDLCKGKHVDNLGPKQALASLDLPALGAPPESSQEERVDDKGQ